MPKIHLVQKLTPVTLCLLALGCRIGFDFETSAPIQSDYTRYRLEYHKGGYVCYPNGRCGQDGTYYLEYYILTDSLTGPLRADRLIPFADRISNVFEVLPP